MRLWTEEQFGPVLPIATFKHIDELSEYYKTTTYGQQASIFTTSASTSASLLDVLAVSVGRVNINTQCGRSPDVLPFSGRRSSALGTMSVTEALLTFSIETVVAGKVNAENEILLNEYKDYSMFLKPLKNNNNNKNNNILVKNEL
jgi:glyceraldehyde-3-phosphate dehydrogenase (NADP+)